MFFYQLYQWQNYKIYVAYVIIYIYIYMCVSNIIYPADHSPYTPSECQFYCPKSYIYYSPLTYFTHVTSHIVYD